MFDNQFQRVVCGLSQDLKSSYGPQLELAVKTAQSVSDLRAILDIKIDPNTYTCPEAFFKDYQTVELIRKLDIPEDVKRLSREAQDVFRQCERTCAETNVRLNSFLFGMLDHPDDVAISDFIADCKLFISQTLGPVPLWLEPKFGPGATFNDRGSLTTIPDKMSSQPTVTPGGSFLVPLLRDTAWFRALYERNVSCSEPSVVLGNRFTTVPKDATKRRGICIEPSINVSLQLAVGAHMKRRLLTRGLDLKGGQQLHRKLAQQASLDGLAATIDLSNASDTVAYNLVKLMLPKPWFELLDTLRSEYTRLNQKWVRLHKFSSMGNGFTFELESLIFAAIIHGCGGKIGTDSFVYGDDLIVPTDLVKALLPALSYFGFTPNKRKTFVDGPFRESCGGDFFKGQAVRPHYIKELPNEPQDWIKLANGLRRVGNSNPHDPGRWGTFQRAWFRCLDALPTNIRRLRGPSELGDIVINDDTWETRWRHGIGHVRVYRPVSRPLPWFHWHPGVQLASALYGVPSKGPIPRSDVAGYKVGYAYFS